MRILILIIVAALIYFLWPPPPPPPPPPPSAAQAEPSFAPNSRVDFAVFVAVDKLYDHWRLSLSAKADERIPRINVAEEFNKIRQVLADRYKQHTEEALEGIVRQSVAELREKKYRWAKSEDAVISEGILSLRRGQR